jgi:probable rRNA maturation factor
MRRTPRLDMIAETRAPRGLRGRLRTVMLELMRRHDVQSEVCIVLTDDEHMRALKLQHWGEDATTDVLSFPAWEPGDPFVPDTLGDIVISLPMAKAQAEARGHAVTVEVCVLAAHGLTHLLGFDHRTDAEWPPFHDAEREVLDMLNPMTVSPVREDSRLEAQT